MSAPRSRAPVMCLAVALAACGGGSPPSEPAAPADPQTSPTDELPPDCKDSTGTPIVAITAVDNEFEPFCVIVSADQRFEVTNEGISRHTFTIRDSDIDIRLKPGAEATTGPIGEVAEPGSGEQEFGCLIHPSMVGYFAVE
jgi:plastocyanin